MSIEDRAQEHEALMWERINRPRTGQASYEPDDPRYGPEDCERCEDAMPTVRRSYGFSLCVTCAGMDERVKARR